LRFLASDDKIHAQYSKLVELFSPENIEANAYKLPTYIYIYYLKNNSNPDINDKIQKFLDLSKKYMFSQVKRIENRRKQDMPRYDPDYLLTSFRDGKKIFEEDTIQKIIKGEKYWDNTEKSLNNRQNLTNLNKILIFFKQIDINKLLTVKKPYSYYDDEQQETKTDVNSFIKNHIYNFISELHGKRKNIIINKFPISFLNRENFSDY